MFLLMDFTLQSPMYLGCLLLDRAFNSRRSHLLTEVENVRQERTSACLVLETFIEARLNFTSRRALLDHEDTLTLPSLLNPAFAEVRSLGSSIDALTVDVYTSSSNIFYLFILICVRYRYGTRKRYPYNRSARYNIRSSNPAAFQPYI